MENCLIYSVTEGKFLILFSLFFFFFFPVIILKEKGVAIVVETGNVIHAFRVGWYYVYHIDNRGI